jgi:hypothetical protein
MAHDRPSSQSWQGSFAVREELRFVLTLLVLAIAPVALLFWAWLRLLPQRRSR